MSCHAVHTFHVRISSASVYRAPDREGIDEFGSETEMATVILNPYRLKEYQAINRKALHDGWTIGEERNEKEQWVNWTTTRASTHYVFGGTQEKFLHQENCVVLGLCLLSSWRFVSEKQRLTGY